MSLTSENLNDKIKVFQNLRIFKKKCNSDAKLVKEYIVSTVRLKCLNFREMFKLIEKTIWQFHLVMNISKKLKFELGKDK